MRDDPIRLDEASLPAWLVHAGLLAPGESPRIEPAGDGNINWVRRVRVGDRSFVVKQARPALERFPEYRVSTERIVFESRWLDLVRGHDADHVCPRVLRFDAEARVLVLEDLGEVPRLDRALAEGFDAAPVARRLGLFLGRVHAATAGQAGLADAFRNDEMRRLHGEHIFLLPFRPNDFPLTPAVRARAEALWGDAALVREADAAFARYLEPRGALLHGDVQAGNVLLGARGAVLLDAEIAHVGDPAFDVGTLLAHLQLAAAAQGRAKDAQPALDALFEGYGETASCDAGLRAGAQRYAAFELLRRTLGAARVPEVESPEAALAVVDHALALLRG